MWVELWRDPSNVSQVYLQHRRGVKTDVSTQFFSGRYRRRREAICEDLAICRVFASL